MQQSTDRSRQLTLEDVAPELRAALGRIPRVALDRWVVRAIARLVQPRLPARVPPGVRIETSRAGRGMRIYHPPERRTRAALFWVHGGGYLVGHPSQNDVLCGAVARRLGITVFAPRYRFSPEHPYPAALDDLTIAWRRVLSEPVAFGFERTRVAIGGESAGGGLAAALVQRLHDRGGIQPVAQWLFCPMLDDRTAADRELDAARHFLWTNRLNAFGWRSYLGIEPGASQVPEYAVPARREDLAGLPPAWIGVGTIDLFHAEDAAYAARLQAAGVPTRLVEAPGGPHAFDAIAPDAPMSRAFDEDAIEWLAGMLGAG